MNMFGELETDSLYNFFEPVAAVDDDDDAAVAAVDDDDEVVVVVELVLPVVALCDEFRKIPLPSFKVS